MDIVYALTRFVHYGLLLGLFGVTAFRSFGLRQSIARSKGAPIGWGISAIAIAAIIVTFALMLVSISVMMGQALTQLEWATVEAIISTTDLGWAFLARCGFLIAAVAICLYSGRLKYPYLASAICFGLAIATLPWSGHAAAGEGLIGELHRMNDVVHLLASGMWLGGIGWFLHLTNSVHRKRADLAGPLLADMHSFAPLGVTLVAVIAITGFMNAQLIFGLQNVVTVVQTNYGWLLLVKILLVGAMLCFGARHAYIGWRHASFDHATIGDTKMVLTKLRFSLGTELLLGISVLALVALIGMMSPVID